LTCWICGLIIDFVYPARRKAVRIALVTLLFAASAFAQTPPTVAAAACGPEQVSFNVKKHESQHAPTEPDPGKARVYFFHDAGTSFGIGYPTTKLGMNGAWVGANHDNSYFSVTVDPGEQHICAVLQSSLVDQRVELAHFTAEAGKIYYYRTRLVVSRSVELLELNPIDSDQAKYLIASFSLSVSSPKK
jgi:hypothetical protein